MARHYNDVAVPRLRLVPTLGRPMTLAAIADEAAIEDRVRREEAHKHVAHLRLLARQLPLWTDEQAARMLRNLAASYEAKWATPEDGRAA